MIGILKMLHLLHVIKFFFFFFFLKLYANSRASYSVQFHSVVNAVLHELYHLQVLAEVFLYLKI